MIREARRDEADVLAAIQRDASLAALGHVFPPESYPYPIDDVRQRWRDALGDAEATVLVAEEDATAAGVAMARSEWLDGLYVLPAWWGTGIAQRLHDEALERVRGGDAEQCHLWVLEANDRARRFYERLGWRQNETTRVVPFPPHPIDVGYSIEL